MNIVRSSSLSGSPKCWQSKLLEPFRKGQVQKENTQPKGIHRLHEMGDVQDQIQIHGILFLYV